MKIYSPKKIIFPKGVARGEYDLLGWINLHMSRTSMQLIVYYTESTHGHGLLFLLLLTDFHMLHILIVLIVFLLFIFLDLQHNWRGMFPKMHKSCTKIGILLCFYKYSIYFKRSNIYASNSTSVSFCSCKNEKKHRMNNCVDFLDVDTLSVNSPLIERGIACLLALPSCLFSIDRLPRTFTCQRRINLAGKFARLPKRWNMKFIFGEYEFYSSESRVLVNQSKQAFYKYIYMRYNNICYSDPRQGI